MLEVLTKFIRKLRVWKRSKGMFGGEMVRNSGVGTVFKRF